MPNNYTPTPAPLPGTITEPVDGEPRTVASVTQMTRPIADAVAQAEIDIAAVTADAVELSLEEPGSRLSTEVTYGASYEMVPTSDAAGASAIGLVYVRHPRISLWNGSRWVSYTLQKFATHKLTLSGMTSGKNYDVFAYLSSGNVRLELGPAWTNDTTRATDLIIDPADANWKGLITKSGDPTRLYVGTIRATAAGTTDDTKTDRLVWSRYNQIRRPLFKSEHSDTASWTYTDVWRVANGDSHNRVAYVTGMNGGVVDAEVQAHAKSSGTGNALDVAIGFDSDSTPVGVWHGVFSNAVANSSQLIRGRFHGHPGLGYHELRWIEQAGPSNTNTFYGTDGSSLYKSGITGSIDG